MSNDIKKWAETHEKTFTHKLKYLLAGYIIYSALMGAFTYVATTITIILMLIITCIYLLIARDKYLKLLQKQQSSERQESIKNLMKIAALIQAITLSKSAPITAFNLKQTLQQEIFTLVAQLGMPENHDKYVTDEKIKQLLRLTEDLQTYTSVSGRENTVDPNLTDILNRISGHLNQMTQKTESVVRRLLKPYAEDIHKGDKEAQERLITAALNKLKRDGVLS